MFSNIKHKISEYLRIKTEQIKLEAAGHVSKIMSMLIGYLFIAIFLVFFILFLCIALAIFLNEWLDNPYYGYLILSGILLLKIIILFVFLRTGKMEKFIERMIVKSIKSQQEDD